MNEKILKQSLAVFRLFFIVLMMVLRLQALFLPSPFLKNEALCRGCSSIFDLLDRSFHLVV